MWTRRTEGTELPMIAAWCFFQVPCSTAGRATIRQKEEGRSQGSREETRGRAPLDHGGRDYGDDASFRPYLCAPGSRLGPGLGAHLVGVSHSEPYWNADAGRVLVKQRTRLYGLEIDSRSVSYGAVDPAKATEIFIREGLVNDTVTWAFDFLAHNRRLRGRLESVLTRLRENTYLNLDEAAYRFYAERIQGVSAVAELVNLVRERRHNEPKFLMMQEEDLRGTADAAPDREHFPEAVPIENRAIPLHYAYKPGKEDDGVTLNVNLRQAGSLTAADVDWAVPGHLLEKVEHYLRALPKEHRKLFVPLAETARELTETLAKRRRQPG